jgi:hypothetical protein
VETAVSAIAVVAGLTGLAVLLAGTIWLAWWTLEPINRAGGALNAPTRFMLADFLGLMVLLQVGLAICGRALTEAGTGRAAIAMYWFLIAVTAVLILVLWAASVSVVSRAGIRRTLRRLTVIVLLVPGTLAAIIGVPMLLALLFVSISALFTDDPADTWFARQIPWILLSLGGVAIVVVVLRRLAFWSLAGSTYAPALAPASASGGSIAPPLPQGFVKQHRGGSREVQAIDPPEHRQADGGDIGAAP